MRTLTPILLLTACALGAATADAADLAGHSRLGAVFAEPAAKTGRTAIADKQKPVEEPIVTYAPEVDVSSVVHGYYGKPNSYYYHNYYGTKPDTIFDRAPYGCGWHGYC